VTATAHRESGLAAAIRQIADDVAAPVADDVDREARFPHEALDALRASRALSAYVPVSHGGDAIGFAELGRACFDLSRACASTGMIFAMHQIQVGSIVRHGVGTPFFDDYLAALSSEQRLIASATSELGVGGDLRRSIAPLVTRDGGLEFEKQGPTVSYGAHADDLLTTVRRAADAEQSDQALVLTRREETTLEQTSTWDPLGMRGTCSPGFRIRATLVSDQILPAPFAQIAVETMVPFSHLLWAQVWLGIATAAYDRSRSFVRAQASTPGSPPPLGPRLSAVATELQAMRAEVEAATGEYSAMIEAGAEPDRLQTVGYAIRVNTLKISASERAPRICTGALGICGMAGYKNDTPFSVGRHLRDALSAALMIANDRIHATNAGLLLIHKGA
jgi:acyl-CoA dehydrogenase